MGWTSVAPEGVPGRQIPAGPGTRKVGATTVHYKVVLPTGYDPAKAYPAILALGGGPQTMNTVDGILNRNYRAESEKRGYIVVAPAAPEGQLFFEDGARHGDRAFGLATHAGDVLRRRS